MLAERLEAEIEVPGSPDWPVAAFDSLWVLAPDLPLKEGGGTPGLVRIDPTTNAVISTIELPDRLCQGFVATEDALWACARDALVRIDPATDTITSSVPIEGAQKWYRPAYGDGLVWALGSDTFVADTIIALDPDTETTSSYALGAPAGGIAYGLDALWATIPSTGAVVRLDPTTGELSEVATGLVAPGHITAGADDLWVSQFGTEEEQALAGDIQVVRLDPSTGEVLAEFAIGGSPQGGVDVLATDDAVYVRSTTPWLTRIDPATDRIVDAVVAGTDVNPAQGPMALGFGSLWTVNIEQDSVYRLSPS
jgi:streptogramin lyase